MSHHSITFLANADTLIVISDLLNKIVTAAAGNKVVFQVEKNPFIFSYSFGVICFEFQEFIAILCDS